MKEHEEFLPELQRILQVNAQLGVLFQELSYIIVEIPQITAWVLPREFRGAPRSLQ